MKIRPLIIATLVGIALQVVLVLAGHVIRVLQNPGFALGGMAFAAVAGWIHVRMARGDWRDTLIGGAIAGGACAAVGIAVSATLGDMPFSRLIVGTAGSVATGIAGAAIARLLSGSRG